MKSARLYVAGSAAAVAGRLNCPLYVSRPYLGLKSSISVLMAWYS
jgi:hypothetical protein